MLLLEAEKGYDISLPDLLGDQQALDFYCYGKPKAPDSETVRRKSMLGHIIAARGWKLEISAGDGPMVKSYGTVRRVAHRYGSLAANFLRIKVYGRGSTISPLWGRCGNSTRVH